MLCIDPSPCKVWSTGEFAWEKYSSALALHPCHFKIQRSKVDDETLIKSIF